jgi:rhodanese-related sulfurtransferase
METPLEVDVTTAAAQLKAGALLLDVREPNEVAICAVAGSLPLPMRQLPASIDQLPKNRPILVLCHTGGRSMRVTQILRANGYPLVSNVAGGIDAWARQIDPTLAIY